jgi:hypothetical protein
MKTKTTTKTAKKTKTAPVAEATTTAEVVNPGNNQEVDTFEVVPFKERVHLVEVGSLQIVAMMHGWVQIATVAQVAENFVVFRDAFVLRQWGTKNGLGQIAPGPTDETEIDPTNGDIVAPLSSIVFCIAADAEGWAPTFREEKIKMAEERKKMLAALKKKNEALNKKHGVK